MVGDAPLPLFWSGLEREADKPRLLKAAEDKVERGPRIYQR